MRRWIYLAALGAAMALCGLLIWQLDLGSWQALDLGKIRTIPESTLVLDAEGQSVGALYTARSRKSVSLKQIPDHVINAFLAAEDQRFYQHSGVDYKRIFGALWHDLKTMSLEQGASTITQQLIKLTHLSSEKTLSRKAQEAVLARKLERRMDKDEILEAYLNAVYFGNGAYGVAAAAQAYFDQGVESLSLAQGALLAGIIKSPSQYAPHIKPENALRRRNAILDRMLEIQWISPEEHAQAVAEELQIAPQTQAESPDAWYMDQVMLEAEAILDMDSEEILTAGLHIYTGFRPEFQRAADALFENGANFPDPAQDGTPVQAAMIALDAESGEIAAIVGGREYEVRRGLNRATQIQRQPGSALKPVSTYAAAIEKNGFLPSSTVEDVQREFAGKYLPGNAGGAYYGTVTLREALSRSLNVATVDLADLIGIQRVRNAIAAFGLPLAAQDVNLSLALGSMTYGVSPAQLCAAYCAIANGGARVNAHAIRRITNAHGKTIYEYTAPAEAAVSAQTAFLLADMLKTAASSGSAKALAACGLPVLGKTGTVGEAGGGNRDIWTAAAVPELAIAVWMGYDEPSAEHAIADWAGGSSYPAQLCAAFLKEIAPSLSGADFTPPEGLIPARIDAIALKEKHAVQLAAANTPNAYAQIEWFPEDRLPTETSDAWNAPREIVDLTLLSRSGDPPALAFTAQDDFAEYLVLRRSGDETDIAAVLQAEAGHVIVWSDSDAQAGESYEYSILPRHKLLYENGKLLTGSESERLRWPVGGLLNQIFGADTAASE